MQKFAAFLIAFSTLVSGCAVYGTPPQDRGHDREQSSQRKPVDRDRDSVPDVLERGHESPGAPNPRNIPAEDSRFR